MVFEDGMTIKELSGLGDGEFGVIETPLALTQYVGDRYMKDSFFVKNCEDIFVSEDHILKNLWFTRQEVVVVPLRGAVGYTNLTSNRNEYPVQKNGVSYNVPVFIMESFMSRHLNAEDYANEAFSTLMDEFLALEHKIFEDDISYFSIHKGEPKMFYKIKGIPTIRLTAQGLGIHCTAFVYHGLTLTTMKEFDRMEDIADGPRIFAN